MFYFVMIILTVMATNALSFDYMLMAVLTGLTVSVPFYVSLNLLLLYILNELLLVVLSKIYSVYLMANEAATCVSLMAAPAPLDTSLVEPKSSMKSL